MVWGTPGFTATQQGASGATWNLTFERRLAPRPGHKENPASSVWLVRTADGRMMAAKRQNVARSEVDALVDEAAAWRKVSLDCAVYAELHDVFVEREAPCSVTFLHTFCSRGHLPKRAPSQAVLLTLVAELADACAVVARATGRPHANLSYDTVLVDDHGLVRLIGFGAQRSAKLATQSPAPSADLAHIAELLYTVVLGKPLRGASPPPDALPYDAPTVVLVNDMLHADDSRMPCDEAVARARQLGAELRAPVIDLSERTTSRDEIVESMKDDSTTAPDVQRAVEKLTTGIDAGGAYSAVLSALERDAERSSRALFKALYNCPLAKDPLCAMRALTLLHNAMLDGPPQLMDTARANDKFLDWVESTWSEEAVRAVQNDTSEEPHPACSSFAAGELAFYTALLRRKARFHMLAAGGFSGAWERTGKASDDGKDVLTSRRRKVVGGMADLAEMASEIGTRFADATDAETALKHASLRAIVDECCRAANAAHGLASETKSVRDAEKLVPSFSRLWKAATSLLSAVKKIHSAGAEDWADQFADDSPPDVVKEADFRIRGAGPTQVADDMPKDGWEETEKIMGDADGDDDGNSKKSKKKKKKKEVEEEALNADESAVNGEEEVAAPDITAADGAMVLLGADAAEKAAVATMFGDLLKLDGGDTSDLRDEVDPRAARAPGELTDGQALASAFGATMPEEGYDYDDEGDGAYEDYQTRQAEAKAAASTGAWAANAGYGNGALVVHQPLAQLAPGQRPAFCGYGDDDDDDVDDAASYESVEYEVEPTTNIPRVVPPPKVLLAKKLRLGEKIGEGALGVVHKGDYKHEPVAVKKLNKKWLESPNARAEFANEVLVLCALDHPNVLRCIAATLKGPIPTLVTDLMKRGTLFDVLHKARIKLTWSMVRKIALHVASGMAYCHQQGVVHRDLKANNVLVDQAYNAKLADFGLAGPPGPPSPDGVAGTYQYMAPEVLQGRAHSYKSDVYAFGILLCEMISGAPPFHGTDALQAAQQVLDDNLRPPLPRHCNRAYADLIKACWATSANKRPTFADIVARIEASK